MGSLPAVEALKSPSKTAVTNLRCYSGGLGSQRYFRDERLRN